jgi:hypothetical protein
MSIIKEPVIAILIVMCYCINNDLPKKKILENKKQAIKFCTNVNSFTYIMFLNFFYLFHIKTVEIQKL